ncbi:hypothetical protein [Romboutsia ilealis]|uniref:hypothetical protein n=1 Tax=Romboutsia ilealis TaxID=1115758 RepID=UPI002573C3C9|nr:hypothetical protein [Romboutsia ilealis]
MSNRVVKAINNIFKEAGHKVISIKENTINTRKFEERTYTYKIYGDLIVIKNRIGLKVFEKSIQSYQDLNISIIIE